jgi:isopenicillin N synthase-like dioxygenase
MSRLTVSASLPVIDISPWLNPREIEGPGRVSVSAALHNACLEYGFFYLDISSYVDAAQAEELLQLGREFFQLPQEEKDRYSLLDNDHARGVCYSLSYA